MTTVLDAGALVALERGDAAMWERLKVLVADGEPPITHGGVVAQVWRGGDPRQALLARALASVDVHALDDRLGRMAGALLARTGGTDAVDAAVAALAVDGDHIVTSDLAELDHLVAASGRTEVRVVPT